MVYYLFLVVIIIVIYIYVWLLILLLAINVINIKQKCHVLCASVSVYCASLQSTLLCAGS